ncbi:MAG: hypothetical protein SGARI_000214 [Bacillariaceae sp.]
MKENPATCAQVTVDKKVAAGVHKLSSGRFKASINFFGLKHSIGIFDSRRDAALAFQIIRKQMKASRQIMEERAPAELNYATARAGATANSSSPAPEADSVSQPHGCNLDAMMAAPFESVKSFLASKSLERSFFEYNSKDSSYELRTKKALWQVVHQATMDWMEQNPVSCAQATLYRVAGVHQLSSGRFKARISFFGLWQDIGVFDTRREAALAFQIIRNQMDSAREMMEERSYAEPNHAGANSSKPALEEDSQEEPLDISMPSFAEQEEEESQQNARLCPPHQPVPEIETDVGKQSEGGSVSAVQGNQSSSRQSLILQEQALQLYLESPDAVAVSAAGVDLVNGTYRKNGFFHGIAQYVRLTDHEGSQH